MKYWAVGERERERQRDRETEREREIDRERQRMGWPGWIITFEQEFKKFLK